MLWECCLLLYCDRLSEGQLQGRGLCLSVFPLPSFFLCSYLCSQFLFFPTVSVDSSSEFPAGGLIMTSCLTHRSSFSASSVQLSFWCVAVISNPLSTIHSQASVWGSARFCCLISPLSHRSWPPFALKQCYTVFPVRLAIVTVVVAAAVLVCELWRSALSQCTLLCLYKMHRLR